MLDAYLPVCDTIKPCLAASANDQPWRTLSNTQTLFCYLAPRPSVKHGLSSHDEKISTFVVLDSPALAGLERLRTFKGWENNWDAEGAKAPEPQVVDFATKVFSLLSVHRVPTVTLNAEGQPMFVYTGSHPGEVVVTSVDRFDYFFAQDDAPEREDMTLVHATLPDDLIAYLRPA